MGAPWVGCSIFDGVILILVGVSECVPIQKIWFVYVKQKEC